MRPYLLAVLDKAARTALQVAAGYLVAARTVGTVDWRTVALATGLAVIASVAQSVVDFPAIPGGWLSDVAARALRTFAQTVAGSVGASVLLTDVPWSTVLTAAALAALSSVVTSSAATPFGHPSSHGTPALAPVPIPGYVGYTDVGRHLKQTPTHTTTAITAGTVAVLAFTGITATGLLAASTPQSRPAIAVPARPLVAPPITPPARPDRAPAYLAALQRDGVPTPARSAAALLLVANSVCPPRGSLSDAQQTDQIVAGFGDKWTRPQVSIIVDDAIATYCA